MPKAYSKQLLLRVGCSSLCNNPHFPKLRCSHLCGSPQFRSLQSSSTPPPRIRRTLGPWRGEITSMFRNCICSSLAPREHAGDQNCKVRDDGHHFGQYLAACHRWARSATPCVFTVFAQVKRDVGSSTMEPNPPHQLILARGKIEPGVVQSKTPLQSMSYIV